MLVSRGITTASPSLNSTKYEVTSTNSASTISTGYCCRSAQEYLHATTLEGVRVGVPRAFRRETQSSFPNLTAVQSTAGVQPADPAEAFAIR